MGHFTIFIPVVTCLLTGTFGTYFPDVVYLDEYCNQVIPYLVTADVRIKLSRSFYLSPATSCTIGLTTTDGNILTAQFLDYSMSNDYVNVYGNCQVESIQLFNSAREALLTSKDKAYCNIFRPSSQFILGVTGSFNFITHGYSKIKTATVDLLVTTVAVKQSAKGSKCPSRYFDCYYNNYCVNNAVTCNGYDDCGNNRDETEGCGLTVAVIAGVVIGIIVFVIIVTIVIVLLVFRRRRYIYTRIG